MDFKSRYQYDGQSDLIGRGFYTSVFRAKDTVLGRTVALKFFSSGSNNVRSELPESIGRAIDCDHRNLCRYFDYATVETTNFHGAIQLLEIAVLEHVDAGNMSDYLKGFRGTIGSGFNKVNIAFFDKLDLLLEGILQGIIYLHNRGIRIHNLKPENILVKVTSSGPVAKISDFGIVQNNINYSTGPIPDTSFLAPEQLWPGEFDGNRQVGLNADLWSFGVMLYAVITGESLFGSAFDFKGSNEIKRILQNGDYVAQLEKLPEPYRSIAKVCLVVNPTYRIQRADELLNMLKGSGAALDGGSQNSFDSEKTVVLEKKRSSFVSDGGQETVMLPRPAIQTEATHKTQDSRHEQTEVIEKNSFMKKDRPPQVRQKMERAPNENKVDTKRVLTILAICLGLSFWIVVLFQLKKHYFQSDESISAVEAPLYPEVTIGSQVWMSENLNVETFRNGDSIPQAKSSEEWVRALKDKKPAWCYYENLEIYGPKYGKLYNGFAINDSRGLAPEGWRIPTDEDWRLLIVELGDGQKACKAMKNFSDQPMPGDSSTYSGFNALYAGGRSEEGLFEGLNLYCVFSCAMDVEGISHLRYLASDEDFILRIASAFSGVGVSVRCVKNSQGTSKGVKIGNQTWMKQNLNVSSFRNGAMIKQARTPEEWRMACENEEPVWCYYDNDPANGAKYGKIYNGYAVTDDRGLAPEGWRVPALDEVQQMLDALGGSIDAGPKMKSNTGWAQGKNGVGSSGFNALPGGLCSSGGESEMLTGGAHFWTRTEEDDELWCYMLISWQENVMQINASKCLGYYVRCVED